MDEIMRISDDISVSATVSISLRMKRKTVISSTYCPNGWSGNEKYLASTSWGKPDENVPAKLEVKNLSHPSLLKRSVSLCVRGKSSDFLAWWGRAFRCDEGAIWPRFVSRDCLIDGKEVRIANPKQAIDHGMLL